MSAAFDLANPSSLHAEGRAARAAVERARASVAAAVGAQPERVVFTSGGTEANNAALSGLRDERGRPDLLLVSGLEHPCVLAGHGFAPEDVRRLPVTPEGALDLGALDAALVDAAGRRVLLALQTANNETGVIQPVREAAERVHAAGGLVYSDAVQALGKIAVDLATLGADAIGLSAHKIGGPKGVGALVFARPGVFLAQALLRGGGQERGQRAGTENVPGVVGFGVAAEGVPALLAKAHDVAARRDRMEDALRRVQPGVVCFGASVARLPNTTLVATPGRFAETELIAFDLAGVALSSGSACSSGKVRPSGVLESMGVPDALARCALRVSLSDETTDDDVDRFLAVFAARARLDERRAA